MLAQAAPASADGFSCENVLWLRFVAGPPALVLLESILGWRLMRPKFLLFSILILPLLAAHAQHQFRVLHSFGAGNDGAGVWDSVTIDASGNVYGTTSGKGVYGGGTVFRLTLGSGGHWSETILHNFGWENDGAGPLGGVILGISGRLYGTTQVGGAYSAGTVFELASGPHGWKETTLYSFGNNDPACCPWGNLTLDPNGNLYGTGGSAFEVSPGSKKWVESILHSFTGKNGDGAAPFAGPIRDAAGDLYGTTRYGGGGPLCAPDGCGIVWQLLPPAADESSGAKPWTEHILHRFGFSQNDGDTPALGQLAMDAAGNLYGAAGGGKYHAGVVFKLTRVTDTSQQTWRETILYSFTGGADGDSPGGGVILDSAGNLYGTTIAGGTGNGVVFKLSPQADGSWKYTLLHTFVGTDGSQPDANLTLGPDGKLYGTTATGGAHGGGVVFQLTP
jgi:uncharacterized repeat protein (TIGR03803 family)